MGNGRKWNHTNKHSVTVLKKRQYVSNTHIPMHFELNHTSPSAAFMAADRESAGVIFLFHHSCNSHTLLLSSVVTFVIGTPLHDPLRQPLNLKDPSKAIPSFPPAPIPSSLRWASMKSLQGEGYALWMYRPWYKENRDFHPNNVPLKRTGGGANGAEGSYGNTILIRLLHWTPTTLNYLLWMWIIR